MPSAKGFKPTTGSLLILLCLCPWENLAITIIENEDECWNSDDAEKHNETDIYWNELLEERQEFYKESGWTEKIWNSGEAPYASLDWKELGEKKQDAVKALGWTEEEWKKNIPDRHTRAEKTPWEFLTSAEISAAEFLGYDESTWMAYDWGKEFDPIVVPLPIPELQQCGLDYLGQIEAQVQLRDGDTIGDDELGERTVMSMKEYIEGVKRGSKLKLLYEDEDPFKVAIRDKVGSKVTKYLGDAIRKSPLREKGHFKPEWDDVELGDGNWMIFVGAKNSSTAMHNDDDTFNFLWVAEGRKRVVMIPNDHRTVDQFNCVTFVNDSCWTHVDVLHGPLPDHAVELELGPGDGLMIPHLAWHAVKNIEPTVAFGFRIDVDDESE
mmetsp:Transcript_16908/g.24801  ORF Transcript_16908/g.24801 Transcript_16908/m.24801 type:complete len:381 (-) Transcript_16908:185-1327(-)